MVQKIVIYIVNRLKTHSNYAFNLWGVNNPSTFLKIKRLIIFISSALIVSIWPVENHLIENSIFLTAFFIFLIIYQKTISRWIILFYLNLNIVWIFYLVQYFLPKV